jgi:hypothetical protein
LFRLACLSPKHAAFHRFRETLLQLLLPVQLDFGTGHEKSSKFGFLPNSARQANDLTALGSFSLNLGLILANFWLQRKATMQSVTSLPGPTSMLQAVHYPD